MCQLDSLSVCQSVSQSVRRANLPSQQPVRRQSTSKFPFTISPAYTHSYGYASAYYIQIRQGANPKPRPSHLQPHCLRPWAHPEAACFRGGSAYVPRSVAEFSNLFFSKWFKALHVLGDDVSSSPNKLLMEIHAFRIIDFWAGRKLFLSLSLSIDI